MSDIKNTEDVVLTVLQRNKRARKDDFILYGSTLKELGISLQMTLYDFLSQAKQLNAPSFETVTRCRRHIQELMPQLKDIDMAVKREDRILDFKEYNLSDIRRMNK